jgi:hypothetical protein
LGVRPKLFSYIRTGYIVSQIRFIGGTCHKSSNYKKIDQAMQDKKRLGGIEFKNDVLLPLIIISSIQIKLIIIPTNKYEDW